MSAKIVTYNSYIVYDFWLISIEVLQVPNLSITSNGRILLHTKGSLITDAVSILVTLPKKVPNLAPEQKVWNCHSFTVNNLFKISAQGLDLAASEIKPPYVVSYSFKFPLLLFYEQYVLFLTFFLLVPIS